MSDTLYDRDILLWSEQQAATLQRLADGERVNDAVDWPNVIEEVLSVGQSEFNTVQSLLEQALVHLLKLYFSPEDLACRHWRTEVAAFRRGAARRFSPSMRQRVDVAEMFHDAVGQLNDADPIPKGHIIWSAACPYTLDDLLPGGPAISDLVAMLPAFDNEGPAA